MIGLSEKSGLYPSCLALNDIEKIGEHPVAAGGFGEVWKGSLGGQFTCIKVVKVYGNSNVQKLFKEFLKEAILWRQLDHPNVIPFLGIYFLDTSKERICLISPWMRNGNLMQYLGGDSHESVDRVVLAYDIACGLSYLHEKKVVHGDLKGQVNILITDLGRAAITDFGLSRVMESEVFTWTSTSTRTVQGTARWLAPECLIKNQPASFDADVYAFGCVCYEVFTGKQPFYHCIYDPKIVVELMEGKRPMRPLDCSHLSDEIWAIMQGVLE
ncbi:Rho guanine nucleotide exchange factor [Stygiomarasmius scandens]|uniref:Rho guanine nucleotide exchange factor n=1 Tax=Marasmiellus scandens TaxID=2682957 RepID=A0ABR1JFT0_9AGAR